MSRKNTRTQDIPADLTYEKAAEGKECFDDTLHHLIYPFPPIINDTHGTGVPVHKVVQQDRKRKRV